MKLRSIRLKDVRRFVAPVRVGPFVDGLNLLAEPNEHGKSTLFDALQAVFFAPATGRSQAVQSLQPHAGGAPEVWVDVETQDGPVEIRKRWLQKPQAEIHRQGRLIAQADAAEAWLAAQLGPEREGGPAGLLWVRQGQAGWETGSKGAREDRLAVRRDLLSSVRGEVETMTGGRRMDAVRARCRADLDIYVTKTGRPLRAGPWQALLDRVAALESDKTDLERRVSQHRETLDARRRLRRELAEITDPEAEAARAAGLRAAENAARAAEAASERAAEAQRALTLAALQAETATAAARRWRDAMDERRAAATAASAADRALQEAETRRASAEAARDSSETGLKAADTALLAARHALDRAERRHRSAADKARRNALGQRLSAAEAARETHEKTVAKLARALSAEDLAMLEERARALEAARNAEAAAAPHLRMQYAAGMEGRVLAGSTPLDAGVAVPIPDGATLTLGDLGTLQIAVAQSADARAETEAAAAALRTALKAHAQPSLDAARAAHRVGAVLRETLVAAKATLEALAPAGLAALRAELAALAPPEAGDGNGNGKGKGKGDPDPGARAEPETGSDSAPDLEAAEAACKTAEAARQKAAEQLAAAREREAAARADLAAKDAAFAPAAARLARAEGMLADAGGPDAGTTHAAMAKAAEADQATARKAAEAAARVTPDLDAVTAARTRARALVETARARVEALTVEAARLDERIALAAGAAPEEALRETVEALDTTRAELGAIEAEVAMLHHLAATLEAARQAARDRYFAPIAAELRPLLGLLWPEAELLWSDETLLPERLLRQGQEEAIGILSGGTQEQIALLVRLAFARLLAASGHPAPVILDDALVFSDDARIEAMFDALHRQTADLQILVLSCRERAFRNLGGHRLTLRPETE